MNSFLKSWVLRTPVVGQYVSRVHQTIRQLTEQRTALEEKVRVLDHLRTNERDTLSSERDTLSSERDTLSSERDTLSSDLLAARSACANVSSMLASVESERDRLSSDLLVAKSERDRLASDLEKAYVVAKSERDRLSSDLEKSYAGQSNLDTHRRALLDQVSLLEGERSSLIGELQNKSRNIERISKDRQRLSERTEAVEASERWMRRELLRSSSLLETLSVNGHIDKKLLGDHIFPNQLIGHSILHARIVECLIQLLLDRPPRAEEKDLYCKELAGGSSYETLVAEILLSPDGRKDRRNRDRYAQFYESNLRFPTTILPDGAAFPIHIVDVGAQLLSMMNHVYAPMLRDQLCKVIGFEPLENEAQLRALREPGAHMLPFFIGDGDDGTFHINAFNPTSSLYPSNPDMMAKFRGLAIVLPTVSTEPASTRRLDDVSEIEASDYLKIDVQGAELKVLAGACRLLEKVTVVHAEVEFDEVYLGQPLFADVDTFLRNAGFELLDLLAAGYDTYREGPPGCEESRLLWNDAVYMKRENLMSDEMLLKGAYIAHANYRKYDLAAHLLGNYDQRCKTDLRQRYAEYFTSPVASKPALPSEPVGDIPPVKSRRSEKRASNPSNAVSSS